MSTVYPPHGPPHGPPQVPPYGPPHGGVPVFPGMPGAGVYPPPPPYTPTPYPGYPGQSKFSFFALLSHLA